MNKLRVGILMDAPLQPAWAHQMIDIIKSSAFAELSLVIRFTAGCESRNEPRKSFVRELLLTAQEYVIGRSSASASALNPLDTSQLLAGVPEVMLIPTFSNECENVDFAQLEEIKISKLDVLIQLCSSVPCGEIYDSARHGVWSYEIGKATVSGFEPGEGWDVLVSNKVTESVLRIRNSDSDPGVIAYKSYSTTNDRSIEDNASSILWKALYFIPRKLEELHRVGKDEFYTRLRKENPVPADTETRKLEEPSTWKFAALLWIKLVQKTKRKWRVTFFLQQWFLMYKFGPMEAPIAEGLSRLMPPKDRFWADPFVVFRDNRYYIFFEECVLDDGNGIISVLALNQDGTFDSPVPVLSKNYHLSYPFIFEHEDELYMMPESCKNRTVDLYKCKKFPYEWEYCANLLNGRRLVDPTLLFWNDRWWLFANSVCNDNASTWDELHLYFSDSLFSENWIEHPKNPIVSDVRSARPAGKIYSRDGRLYRPSQNSSGHYGYGLNISEICTLSETDYEEKIVERIEPAPDGEILSIHTLNYDHGLIVADAQRWRRKSIPIFFAGIWRRARRLT